MVNQTTITMKVEDDQKKRWKEHVEESNQHKNLSQFVRQTVEREIAGTRNTQGGTDDELKEAVYDLVDSNRRIESGIGTVDERLDGIESSLSEPPEDVQELMPDVFDCLPDESTVGSVTQDVLSGEEHAVDDGTVLTGRVEDIADHLNKKNYRVRRAIEQLQSDSSLVQQTEDEQFYRRA